MDIDQLPAEAEELVQQIDCDAINVNFKNSCRVIAEKIGKQKMPSDEKKEPIENLKGKSRSLFWTPGRKRKVMPLKAHFSIWYHLYCYGKERSQLKTLQQAAGNLRP